MEYRFLDLSHTVKPIAVKVNYLFKLILLKSTVHVMSAKFPPFNRPLFTTCNLWIRMSIMIKIIISTRVVLKLIVVKISLRTRIIDRARTMISTRTSITTMIKHRGRAKAPKQPHYVYFAVIKKSFLVLNRSFLPSAYHITDF